MIGAQKKLIQWLCEQPADKLYEIKEYREKRSLNANAYAWALMSKIADAIRASKEEVYLSMLKHYGQSEVISVVEDVSVRGYFKYFEKIGESTLNGKRFVHYKIYKGSSEFDTKEMAILIDGIVHECENLGIETMTEKELTRLKNLWKE